MTLPNAPVALQEVASWLAPSTRETMDKLYGLGEDEQHEVLSRAPFGTRASLSVLGITESYQPEDCRLTEFGREVVEYLHDVSP